MNKHKYEPITDYKHSTYCKHCGKQELIPEHSGFNWEWLERVEILHGGRWYEFVSKYQARKMGFQI